MIFCIRNIGVTYDQLGFMQRWICHHDILCNCCNILKNKTFSLIEIINLFKHVKTLFIQPKNIVSDRLVQQLIVPRFNSLLWYIEFTFHIKSIWKTYFYQKTRHCLTIYFLEHHCTEVTYILCFVNAIQIISK